MIPIDVVLKTVVKLLSVLWKKIVKWILPIVKKAVIAGIEYFITKMAEVMLQKLKEYEKKGKQWFVTETTKVIKSNEIPSEIENKVSRAAMNREINCSAELEEQLELTV